MANRLLALRRLMDAEQLALRILANEPQNADAHTIRAAAHWARGEPSASMAAAQTALRYEPEHDSAGLFVSQVLQGQGRHREALDLLTQHYELAAKDAETRACDLEGPGCAAGETCDTQAGHCAPMAEDLLLQRMISAHLLLELDAVRATNELLGQPEHTSETPLGEYRQSLGRFAELLAPHQPLMQIEGERGVIAPMRTDPDYGAFIGPGEIEGVEAEVGCSMSLIEAVISADLVEELGLEPVGEMTMMWDGEARSVVVLDEVRLGGMTLRNVPAYVLPLDPPRERWLLLGRQLTQRLGAVTYDMLASELVFEHEAPAKPASAIEVPAVSLHLYTFQLLLLPLEIGGTRPAQWVWMGSSGPQPLSLSRTSLRGRVSPDPRVEDSPLRVDKLRLGARELGPLPVEVVDNDADTFEARAQNLTSFPIAGSLSLAWLSQQHLTHLPSEGRMWLR